MGLELWLGLGLGLGVGLGLGLGGHGRSLGKAVSTSLLPMLYMVLSTYHPRMSAVSRSFCCIVSSCGRAGREGGRWKRSVDRFTCYASWRVGSRMHRAATGCIGL